jgi:hypothetical protein
MHVSRNIKKLLFVNYVMVIISRIKILNKLFSCQHFLDENSKHVFYQFYFEWLIVQNSYSKRFHVIFSRMINIQQKK